MATDPSEMLGLQTQTINLENDKPALTLVPSVEKLSQSHLDDEYSALISAKDFGSTIMRHLETDGAPYGLAPVFLAGVNEVVPPYTADIYESVIDTGDTEALIFAAEGIPLALKRAIEIKRQGRYGLPDDQMDRMREMWGRLFDCEDEVSEIARQQFEQAKARLQQEDIVTLEWVGGMACRHVRH